MHMCMCVLILLVSVLICFFFLFSSFIALYKYTGGKNTLQAWHIVRKVDFSGLSF